MTGCTLNSSKLTRAPIFFRKPQQVLSSHPSPPACACTCFSSFLITVFLILPLSSFASLPHHREPVQPDMIPNCSPSPFWPSFIMSILFDPITLSISICSWLSPSSHFQFFPFSLPLPCSSLPSLGSSFPSVPLTRFILCCNYNAPICAVVQLLTTKRRY